MKVLKRISGIFICLVTFLFLSHASASAYSIDIRKAAPSPSGTPSFVISCDDCTIDRNGEVEFGGEFGENMMYREKFGQYLLRRFLLCSESAVCRIIENGSSNYDLKLGGYLPPNGCREWHIEKPEGCSYWMLTRKWEAAPYRKKFYIRQIFGRCAWRIEEETIVSGNLIRRGIAILNFTSDIRGELVDLVNFIFFALRYPTLCI